MISINFIVIFLFYFWYCHFSFKLCVFIVFVSLLICWYFGYLFSPIFVAINAGSKLSHILGLIYSLTFGTIICLKTIPCAKNQVSRLLYSLGTMLRSNFSSNIQRSQIMSYCRTIPATTCAYSVSVGFGILLYLAIRQKAPKCLLPKNILGFRYPLPVVLGVFMAFQLIYQVTFLPNSFQATP